MITCKRCKSDDIYISEKTSPAKIMGQYREMVECTCNQCSNHWKQAGAIKDKSWFKSFYKPVFKKADDRK